MKETRESYGYETLPKGEAVIERYARRYPAQWLWMQKRWKIRRVLRRKLEQVHQAAAARDAD